MLRREENKAQTATLPAIRVYKEELEELRNRALEQGKSVSAYVRDLLSANHAPKPSQSSLESTPISIPSTPSNPLPLSAPPENCVQENSLKKEETGKLAGPHKVFRRAHSREHAKAKGECPHGYRILAGRTACSDCKRKTDENS